MPAILRALRLLVPLLSVIVHCGGAIARPNFLIILTDDHGLGDVSAYRRNGDVRTPHIDRIASEGMLFTTMRANATVCSPTRAALLTGRYPDRVGVPGVIRTHPENSWGYFAPGVPTLADSLRSAGYHTALVGKWHLGLRSPNTPNEHGFDHFHGFLGDMMDSYTDHLRHGINYLRHNRDTITPTGHATDLFTDWATAYLRERANKPDQPFLLYLAYNAPHFPIEPPAEVLERVLRRDPQLDLKRATNVAFVEHLDDAIGRVMAVLSANGLDRSTFVAFTSDNGGSLPHGQHNGPFRDGKQTHYDGGLRVPFIVRWPGQVSPGTQNDYRGLVFDLYATALDYAGIALPEETDARSLRPALEGQVKRDEVRELYFVRREGGGYGGKSYEALIRGDWKLLQDNPYSSLELYNLADDPEERTNVAASHPELRLELQTALSRHISRGGNTPWIGAQAIRLVAP